MYEKQGYLTEDYKLFHIKDISAKEYDFHYHDFYKVLFFLKGDVSYIIEGKNYELKPYDIVLVSQNEIHKPIVSGDSEYERIVLYISEGFFQNDIRLMKCFFEASTEHTGVMRLPTQDTERILELLLNAEKRLSEGYYGELYGRLLVTEALARMNESVSKNGFTFGGSVVFNAKIVDACEYIKGNLKGDLSIDSLAERFFISKYHFMRLFKEQTGYPVHQYILEKRLLYTKYLTERGEKVTQACLEAGFKDYSTYLKAKKKAGEKEEE